jgi:pimeloyl-ACP methyl ester carboxylesterase
LDDGGTSGGGSAQSFLGNVFGFLPKFANLSSFLLMFDRCAVIGSAGIAAAARAVRASAPGVRIHLVGHSLGGRAVTACAQALLKAPKVQVETMMLLQAAYSHFGLAPAGTSAQGVKHPRGNFRDVVEKKAVKGAILATHSDQDGVVGFAYTAMAQMSGNNAAAFGDAKSPYGGIGRNGVLDTPEVIRLELKTAGSAYGGFDPAKITTLDGSVQDGGKARIQNHGDVTNAHVTWAFASLLAQV